MLFWRWHISSKERVQRVLREVGTRDIEKVEKREKEKNKIRKNEELRKWGRVEYQASERRKKESRDETRRYPKVMGEGVYKTENKRVWMEQTEWSE